MAEREGFVLEFFKASRTRAFVMLLKILRSPLKNAPPEPFFSAFESLDYIPAKNKKHPHSRMPFIYGGERGIRTLGRVLADTRFPVVRLRPAQPSLQVSLIIISHTNRFVKGLIKFFSFLFQISSCFIKDIF